MDNEKISLVKTGTCTVGIVCKEGIILAADKRASAGEGLIVDRNAMKVHKLGENIVVTIAGTVSDIQMVLRLAKAELGLKRVKCGKTPGVNEAANLFATITYQNIRKFSPILGVSHFILAGKDSKGFSMFDITPDGTVTAQKKFAISGAYGSIIGLGILDNEWKPNMTMEEGKKLAFKIINTAIKRDATVGEGINYVFIDKNGISEIKEELL